MARKKYCYDSEHDVYLDELVPLRYELTYDGISITAGSLYGTGFEPYYANGITLPDSIGGIPVTEFNSSCTFGSVEYIEARSLKRVIMRVEGRDARSYPSDYQRCSPPIICGGAQYTLERMDLIFEAPDMTIGSFSYIPSLRSVRFNGTVHNDSDFEMGSFKEGIFKGCSNLMEVSGFFSGYMTIGQTFEDCTKLTIAPSMRVRRLSDYDFRNCRSLRSYRLKRGLIELGYGVFEGCSSLREIYMPDTVEQFGDACFKGCSSLIRIYIPDCVRGIPKNAFDGCASLEDMFLPDGIDVIESESFRGCRSLRGIRTPANLKRIEDRAFCGCAMLSKVYVPQTVDHIGEDAFSQCPNLVICGARGTIAESYALQNQIAFIEDAATPIVQPSE